MNVSFNSRDISLLIINLLTYRIFTQLPMSLIKSANVSAPLITILGGAVWVLVIFLVARCFTKFSGGNILDAAQSVFGNAGRIIISLIFALYLIFSQIYTLNDISKLASLISFPTSPIWYISGFLMLGSILGAIGNIRTIARLHGVFMPIILIVVILLFVSTILPLGNSDFCANVPRNINFPPDSIFTQITIYADIFLLFLIVPTKESRQGMAKRIGYSGIVALALNSLFILAFILKIPSSIVQNGQFPMYLLMKEVYLGRFLQRLDALILFASALSSMLYISLNLNLLTSVLNQGFHISQKRITTIIISIAVFWLSLNEWIFSKGSLANLIYLFSLGGFAVLIITAIFVKVRRALNEKG